MNGLRHLLFSTVIAIGMGAGVAAAQQTAGTVFPSVSEGVDRFVAAGRAKDMAALDKILGQDGYDILHSGDVQADRNALERFITAYDARHKLVQDSPTRSTLVVGTDDWPMPIPLVKGANGWSFDAAAGRAELLARRIGRNELSTIQACKAFVDAQREYASTDRGDGLLDYAQRFISTPGKQDGLYWPAKPGEPMSPLGPLFVKAQAAGYAPRAKNTPQPFNGYYFRILTGQGPAAKGGAYNYLAHGKLMGGFALIASPATYGVSGVMTFIVNQDGTVFQKDLGPNTATAAAQIKTFDPGPGWKKV
ncbi:MAG TPA: DUF2950 domain-containing protein [Rhizomicrobium sp.]|nr:DUF2950 domain-containing protein [Rhizomicrobium sp.]